MATFFFSGGLSGVGWGCIGGRPKEIKRQEDEAKKTRQSNGNFDDEIV
jgi:hypothetical protein